MTDKAMDESQLADYYDAHGIDQSDWGQAQTLERPARRQVTLSVRFSAEEITALRHAAQRAGVKPTAFIRARALASLQASTAGVTSKALDEAIAALTRDVDRLREAAHAT